MGLNKFNIDRRKAMQLGLGLGGGLLALSPGLKALGAVCGKTPAQPEGPFYPAEHQLDEDSDLTFVSGHSEKAIGPVIYIQGVLTDQNCNPVDGAVVEIWQACASGKYNHPGDTENPAPLDPHFQYWGRALTDQTGHYLLKTILPGSYPAGEGWIRPPHIHFKIHKLGFLELTTQMYFEGNQYNAKDLILKRLSATDQKKVIVKLRPPEPQFDPNSKVGTFDLSLERA